MGDIRVPEPEYFDRGSFFGEEVDHVTVALAPDHRSMFVVMTGANGNSLLFHTNAAGGRQLAAHVLNKSEELKDG